jgi:SAM-dependent methyltransferase
MATPYTFTENSILKGKKVVMHNWETPVMERMARFVCSGGWAERNDILEIGFGMGIASNFIQQYNPTSHTICEIDPEVIRRLEEWASDKPNVKIVKGDWYKNIDNFGKYDGILFDTFDDMNIEYFKKEVVLKLSKPVQTVVEGKRVYVKWQQGGTRFCIWDNMQAWKSGYEDIEWAHSETDDIVVEHQHQDSWNYCPSKNIFVHKITINGENNAN